MKGPRLPGYLFHIYWELAMVLLLYLKSTSGVWSLHQIIYFQKNEGDQEIFIFIQSGVIWLQA